MPETHSTVPTPDTPLRHCAGWHLRLTCSQCRRVSALDCSDLARNLGGSVPLWRCVCRMRCRDCGAVPERVDMLHGLDEARSARAVRTVRLI
jgi:hypothetical protein